MIHTVALDIYIYSDSRGKRLINKLIITDQLNSPKHALKKFKC